MAHLAEIEGKGAADLDTVSPWNLLQRVQRVAWKIGRGGPADLVGFMLRT